MIKLGMPQLFEFDSIENNFKLAKNLNLDFIEFNLNFSSCRKALENGLLLTLINKYKINATLHFYDECDFATYEEVMGAYLNLLDKYASLAKDNIHSMNVHLCPGPVVTISGIKHYVYEKEFEEYKERLIKNLHKAENICNKNNISLVIENTDNLPPYVKNIYPYLYKEGFKFCYDIGHDHLSNDVVKDVLQNTPLPINEFHFHDAKNRNTCHLALGQGELDLKYYKEIAINNDSWVNLEVKSKDDLKISVPYFINL